MSRTTAVRVRNRDGLGGTVENPMDLDRPGAAILVRLADQALYRSKRAGRGMHSMAD